MWILSATTTTRLSLSNTDCVCTTENDDRLDQVFHEHGACFVGGQTIVSDSIPQSCTGIIVGLLLGLEQDVDGLDVEEALDGGDTWSFGRTIGRHVGVLEQDVNDLPSSAISA